MDEPVGSLGKALMVIENTGLFSRREASVEHGGESAKLPKKCPSPILARCGTELHDIVLNFVGTSVI